MNHRDMHAAKKEFLNRQATKATIVCGLRQISYASNGFSSAIVRIEDYAQSLLETIY